MCFLIINSKLSNVVNAFQTYQNKVAGFVPVHRRKTVYCGNMKFFVRTPFAFPILTQPYLTLSYLFHLHDLFWEIENACLKK